MPPMNTRCPDCGVAMHAGFVLDKGEANMDADCSYWVEGTMEKSFWTGVKTKGRAKLPITALRCPECGLLRQYALPVPERR